MFAACELETTRDTPRNACLAFNDAACFKIKIVYCGMCLYNDQATDTQQIQRLRVRRGWRTDIAPTHHYHERSIRAERAVFPGVTRDRVVSLQEMLASKVSESFAHERFRDGRRSAR